MSMIKDYNNCGFDEEMYGSNRRIILTEKVTEKSLSNKELYVLKKRIGEMIHKLNAFQNEISLTRFEVINNTYVCDVSVQPITSIGNVNIDVTIKNTNYSFDALDWENGFKENNDD